MTNEIDLRFLSSYNPWWIDPQEINNDIKIIDFNNSKIKYQHPILERFELEKDAVYTLRGSRQIGKSTILKLLIKKLIKEKKDPRLIFFFPGDYLKDYQELYKALLIFLESSPTDKRKYIFIDEVSFIKGWTRAVKLLSDFGKLKNSV